MVYGKHKMNIYIFLFIIVTLNQKVNTVDIKKLFYEKDLSEYCKRRVIPSIFLGRHVVEASAFILHFSKLDLPYSCFISIRSESGSNMIMVITLPHDSGLVRSCSANSPQFLVYEMGETFGGYWGPLPEAMLNREPPITKYYTLKTTQHTTMTTEPSTEEFVETTTPSPAPLADPSVSEDVIQVEVPIVDVSGVLVPGAAQPTKPFDFEEAFDDQYDVTPIPGVKYDTSILPLVQLSVRKQTGDGRRDDGKEPRYDLDVIQEFTPDSRLTLPQFSTLYKHRTNVNRRLSFGKNRTTKGLIRKKHSRRTTTKTNRFTKYVFPIITSHSKHVNNTPDSWEMINKLINKLNNNKEHQKQESINEQDDNNINKSRIAENISNMKHNFSIYLAPNLSVYNDKRLSKSATKQTTASLPPRSTVNPFRKLIYKSLLTTLATRKIQGSTNIKPISLDTISLTKHQTTPVTSTLESRSSITESFSKENNLLGVDSLKNVTNGPSNASAKPNSIETVPVLPVSLVGHESWENIVQAAPGMAVLLNQTVPYNVVNISDEWSSLNESYRKGLLDRKKRAIHSIAIENGRPHNLTTMATTPTTTKETFGVQDMQEFARLVELQDDDMHGRVALRYLRQYVGPAIYNICEDAQPYSRHVYLFNSSRLVLSLNNFTLSRMSVILTRARTLLSGEMLCPKSQLECQVSGARVCVDSLAACDGVPNCGSNDIYDEDRLMCGVAVGLQHNVYLAAFTFLALLLTLLYAVHYWLKRCVPKVADAFFVYMDGVENILFLDTVMRPPGEYDYGPKMFYHENMFSGENADLIHDTKKSLCSRLWRKCFFCFRNKEAKEEVIEQHEHDLFAKDDRKTYSFTQMELCRMLRNPTVDTSAQTGDSLELAVIEEKRDHQVTRNKNTLRYARAAKERIPIMIDDSLITLDEPLPEDELTLMKFFRDSRSNSSESVLVKKRHQKLDLDTGAAPNGERELSSIMYEGGLKAKPGPSGVNAIHKVSSPTRRRIRFDEATTTIPTESVSDDDGDEEEEKPAGQLRQVMSLRQTRTWRTSHLSTIKEDEESGRPRHFWEGKGKKSKKKTNA